MNKTLHWNKHSRAAELAWPLCATMLSLFDLVLKLYAQVQKCNSHTCPPPALSGQMFSAWGTSRMLCCGPALPVGFLLMLRPEEMRSA